MPNTLNANTKIAIYDCSAFNPFEKTFVEVCSWGELLKANAEYFADDVMGLKSVVSTLEQRGEARIDGYAGQFHELRVVLPTDRHLQAADCRAMM